MTGEYPGSLHSLFEAVGPIPFDISTSISHAAFQGLESLGVPQPVSLLLSSALFGGSNWVGYTVGAFGVFKGLEVLCGFIKQQTDKSKLYKNLLSGQPTAGGAGAGPEAAAAAGKPAAGPAPKH